MAGDLVSGALIEVARDLREKRVSARELLEAAIARHERFGERLDAYSLWAPEQARAVAVGLWQDEGGTGVHGALRVPGLFVAAGRHEGDE